MIAILTHYPEYKGSGFESIGDIPEHWESRKLRTLLRAITERNRPDLPLLSVVRQHGVIKRNISSHEENHNFIPDNLSNYKVVRKGQFVMNKMKAWQGSYGVSRFDGIVSPAYFVFDLKGVTGDFFNLALRSQAYIPFFTKASDGVRIGQWDLSEDRMREITLFVPTIGEQTFIVRYLNYVDRRVRRLIAAKRKLIALLNEQKQTIIHRAVTRGLDPDVRMKDSGVEWLEAVPEHWDILRVGNVIKLTTGFPFKSEGFSAESGIRLLRGVNVSLGRVRWDDVVYWPEAGRSSFKDFELQLGDIVLGMDRPIIRGGVRVARIEEDDLPCLLLQRVARIRPCRKVDAKFLFLLLSGKSFRDYLAPIFTGISVPHLGPEQIRLFRIALPPFDEQAAVVEYAEGATRELDTAISQADKEIKLLIEYRDGLIADVVTGKLDVRAAAAQLPDDDNDLAEALGAEPDVTLEESELMTEPSG